MTGLTCIAALCFTIAWWSKLNVEALLMDSRAFGPQPWRLVTSNWLHVSAPHLLFNLSGIWALGRIVERAFGAWRTIAVFLLLSVGSSAAEFAMTTGGVGLSGLGYGLFGMLWVLRSRDTRFAESIHTRTIVVFVAWFFLCVGLTILQWMPIGNVAHASGWGLGALLGMSISANAPRRIWWRLASAAACGIILVGATVARPFVNFGNGMAFDLVSEADRAQAAGDNERALELLRRALARNDKSAVCWCDLGVVYLNLHRDAQATDAFDRAHQIAPNDPEISKQCASYKFYAAYEAYKRDDFKAAISLYEDSVQLDSSDSAAWYNLGVAYQAVGRDDGAIAAYSRSLALDPKRHDARKALEGLQQTGRGNR